MNLFFCRLLTHVVVVVVVVVVLNWGHQLLPRHTTSFHEPTDSLCNMGVEWRVRVRVCVCACVRACGCVWVRVGA